MISIVVTCHGAAEDLRVILGSLVNQKENEEGETSLGKKITWLSGSSFAYYPIEIIIVSDGPYVGPSPDWLPMQAKIIECPKEGGVGHHTRAVGIEAATGQWIVLTNSDNYFMGGWLHRLVTTINENGGPKKVGAVYWNCINNLWGWSDFGGSKIQRGYIDLSCAAIRADIAKRIGFPYRNYDGDYDYIYTCANRAERLQLAVVQLRETLCVHN